MSLNSTPNSERIHIGIFGRRNAGKSSLINAMTGQELAVVSDTAGTTTDPVSKAMELLPLGPVLITDTPGLDDEGDLGQLRVKKSYQVLFKSDIALLVIDSKKGESEFDRAVLEKLKQQKIPYIKVYNKCDLLDSIPAAGEGEIYTDALNGTNIYELKELIAKQTDVKKRLALYMCRFAKALGYCGACCTYRQSRTKGQAYPAAAADNTRYFRSGRDGSYMQGA